MLTIAVIGAGVSGLTAARMIGEHGHDVQVFDKSRGVGGRLATRRANDTSFDHGAQYFTARDPRLRRLVDDWVHQDLVESWNPRLTVFGAGSGHSFGPTQRYVGKPNMNALAKHLAEGLDVRREAAIQSVNRDSSGWVLTDHGGRRFEGYDVVLVTAPPAQAVPLLSASAELQDQVAGVRMQPCWAVMVGLSGPIAAHFDAAFVNEGPLRWICRNSSKPGRSSTETWVLHAAPEWSVAHLEETAESVAATLWQTIADLIGEFLAKPDFMQAHRWRYALAEAPLERGCLWDPEQRLGVAGDWCNGSRVEGAFLSGLAAAERVLGLSAQPRVSLRAE